MILEDYHIHTSYCDGKHNSEEIIKAAIEKGIKRIGISGHSYTSFDERYCMSIEDTKTYISEINNLKEKYKDRIEILCGIEMDYYAQIDTSKFDYIIGSVHYIKVGNEYLTIDESAEEMRKNIEKYFNNNVYSYAKAYFDIVSDVVNKTNADIIGHFDLLSKFNEQDKMIDENNPEYINAYRKAIDNLILYNKPFEINTGAISRGYRTTAYPNEDMLKYIKQKGGRVILSSDSHSKETLMYKFDEYEKKATELGFSL